MIFRVLNKIKHLMPASLKNRIRGNDRIMALLRKKEEKVLYHDFGYPCQIPPLDVQNNLDFLLLELPPRYMPLMPNGIGYVYNILAGCDICFQVVDANISLYHRFHEKRLREKQQKVVTASGYALPLDPWDNTNTNEWNNYEVLDHFWPDISVLIDNIISAKPKILGISLSGFNRKLAQRLVKALRKKLPDIIIVVGGYDCVYHDLGPFVFSDFDYMIIGEAELTLKPLVSALVKGNKPRDLPGIISKIDSPGRQWSAPIPDNLDAIEWPKYQWAKHEWYQTYDRKHLIPISGSRGCRWGKCRFCAECFKFRKRSPAEIVNEIEYFTKKGFHSFHFNESDVNGDPQNLHDICSEILARKLKVSLVGQLRIDKRNTPEYLMHLANAGFKHLRFGVDGWNDNLLKLMRKGYNMQLVFQNLHNCHAAGIITTVNMVIGVPGETEEDVNECIHNLIKCKGYIHSVESFNTLLLACGSEYYKLPEQYNIHFIGEKDEIYKKYADYVPTDLWYSDHPYIDQTVRVNRLERVTNELYLQGVNIGPFAAKVIERLKNRAPEAAFRP